MDAREIDLDIPGIEVGDIIPIYTVTLFGGDCGGGGAMVDLTYSTLEEAISAYDNFEEWFITDDVRKQIDECWSLDGGEVVLELNRILLQYIGDGLYDDEDISRTYPDFVESLGPDPFRERDID